MRALILTATAAALLLLAATPALASEGAGGRGHLALTGAVGVLLVLLIAGIGLVVSIRKQRHQ